MIRQLTIGLFIVTGIAGCSPRHPDVFLSENHPAEPTAAAGKPIAAPPSLKPELQTASPHVLRGGLDKKRRNFGLPPQPKPTAPTRGGHNMHDMRKM